MWVAVAMLVVACVEAAAYRDWTPAARSGALYRIFEVFASLVPWISGTLVCVGIALSVRAVKRRYPFGVRCLTMFATFAVIGLPLIALLTPTGNGSDFFARLYVAFDRYEKLDRVVVWAREQLETWKRKDAWRENPATSTGIPDTMLPSEVLEISPFGPVKPTASVCWSLVTNQPFVAINYYFNRALRGGLFIGATNMLFPTNVVKRIRQCRDGVVVFADWPER